MLYEPPSPLLSLTWLKAGNSVQHVQLDMETQNSQHEITSDLLCMCLVHLRDCKQNPAVMLQLHGVRYSYLSPVVFVLLPIIAQMEKYFILLYP